MIKSFILKLISIDDLNDLRSISIENLSKPSQLKTLEKIFVYT